MIVIFPVPSNEVPLINLAVANFVAVAALPVTFPDMGFVTVKFAKVPTLVNEDAKTFDAKVAPVNAPASTVMVLFPP